MEFIELDYGPTNKDYKRVWICGRVVDIHQKDLGLSWGVNQQRGKGISLVHNLIGLPMRNITKE